MKRSMHLTLLGSVALFVFAPAFAAVETNIMIPFEDIQPEVFNECNGDTIFLTGNLHVLISTTIDANGGGHFRLHFQPAGAMGVGVPSGLRYRAVGVTRLFENFTSGQTYTSSFVNNFRMIARGPGGGTLHWHQTMHVTINPNGTATADVNLDRLTCK